ncbi:MAG: hypothetical protein JF593_13710 [Novosphingobium sp.]|nr:hypothetical protein [Novosphingobium sp.]
MTFDRPGIVAVGCNIHDSMSAYIYVTDTVWTDKTGAGGAVTFRGTPSGPFTLAVWHPYLRAPGNVVTVAETPSAQARVQPVSVHLRAPAMSGMGGY